MNQSHRDNEPSTSASLLQSARRGDAEGWRRLAQIYGPIIYGWAVYKARARVLQRLQQQMDSIE